MTTDLWLSIPAMAVFFGLWTGVPLWVALRHPDNGPGNAPALPAYLRLRPSELRRVETLRWHDAQRDDTRR